MSTAEIAKGIAAFAMKGIRRPLGFFDRSERFAISGSVMASQMRPNAKMPPRIVRAPKMTRSWVKKMVCPEAIISSDG